MDTLEYRTEVTKEPRVATTYPPILWRGKSARQVYQERYFNGDYKFEKLGEPIPKSTIPGADYCEQYVVTPQKEQKATGYYSYATLTEIPEKR